MPTDKSLESRIGNYYQPARAQGDDHRFHVTGGLDYFFRYIKIGAAFDVEQGYWNTSFSLSPHWKGFKKKERNAKYILR